MKDKRAKIINDLALLCSSEPDEELNKENPCDSKRRTNFELALLCDTETSIRQKILYRNSVTAGLLVTLKNLSLNLVNRENCMCAMSNSLLAIKRQETVAYKKLTLWHSCHLREPRRRVHIFEVYQFQNYELLQRSRSSLTFAQAYQAFIRQLKKTERLRFTEMKYHALIKKNLEGCEDCCRSHIEAFETNHGESFEKWFRFLKVQTRVVEFHVINEHKQRCALQRNASQERQVLVSTFVTMLHCLHSARALNRAQLYEYQNLKRSYFQETFFMITKESERVYWIMKEMNIDEGDKDTLTGSSVIYRPLDYARETKMRRMISQEQSDELYKILVPWYTTLGRLQVILTSERESFLEIAFHSSYECLKRKEQSCFAHLLERSAEQLFQFCSVEAFYKKLSQFYDISFLEYTARVEAICSKFFLSIHENSRNKELEIEFDSLSVLHLEHFGEMDRIIKHSSQLSELQLTESQHREIIHYYLVTSYSNLFSFYQVLRT